jgi:hypothetical protein
MMETVLRIKNAVQMVVVMLLLVSQQRIKLAQLVVIVVQFVRIRPLLLLFPLRLDYFLIVVFVVKTYLCAQFTMILVLGLTILKYV